MEAAAAPEIGPIRVTVFELGDKKGCGGRAIRIGDNLSAVLATASVAFQKEVDPFTHLYTADGALITDISVIRPDETLYASKGEQPEPETTPENEWIQLNVGGSLFQTSRTTVLGREPSSMLARMFNPASNMRPGNVDQTGAFLIDRDPLYFRPILNYLRTGALILDAGLNPKGVREEAEFFGIEGCLAELDELLLPRDAVPLTRRDVVNALITTPNKSTLRFQGVNLTGADLSYLDLRNVNFKYAKLRGAKLSYSNLSFCNFERADMTSVEMVYAILSGVRMACATMEGANCANCNFQDPAGHNANMEGVNLRNAVLEDSDLTGANLRVANLKNANLKSTILRGAILAGADLGNSDLTGSDLHEANLRGANLKDASLELMINPLHMAQAIR